MKSKEKSTFNIDQFKGNLFDNVLNPLFNKEFTLKNLSAYNVSSRNLQYWSENKLFLDETRQINESHKFTFEELIWIKIICELRDLRFPLHRIKKAKEFLFDKKPLTKWFNLNDENQIIDFISNGLGGKLREGITIDNNPTFKLAVENFKARQISLLSFSLMLFVKERIGIKFLVFRDGGALPLFDEVNYNQQEFLTLMEKETYISIPLIKLISSFVSDDKNNGFILKSQILQEDELRLLSLLRTQKFSTISVHFKKGKPFLIEATENLKLSAEARLSEILVNRGYEKIEIKTNDGVIAFSPKTTKYFL